MENGLSPYFPWNYWYLRFIAVCIDFCIAGVIAFSCSFIYHLRPFIASQRDVYRVEVEYLTLEGFRVDGPVYASSGSLIGGTLKGKAQGKFDAPSGRYDIVPGFSYPKSLDASIKLVVGDTVVDYPLTGIPEVMAWDTVARAVEVKRGDSIEIMLESVGTGLVAIDYIDFVPEGSAAYRPNGSERSYNFGHFYKAIGYDDMNVHISFLKIILFQMLLYVLYLSWFAYSPGMFLTGLRVTGLSPPSLRKAVLRQLGNILTVLTGGFGLLTMLLSSRRQSWGDILSRSYVVTKGMIDCSGNQKGTGSSHTGKAGCGEGAGPPLEARALALCCDTLLAVFIVVCITIVVRWTDFREQIIEPTRLEVEDFEIKGSIIYPSIHASSWVSVFWRDARVSDLHTTFNGPDGQYDARIRIHPAEIFPTAVGMQFGQHQEAELLATPKSFAWEILVVPNVHLAPGDTIRIKARAYVFLDYIELTPHRNPVSYLRYYNDGAIIRHFIPGLDTPNVTRSQLFRVGAMYVFGVWLCHIVLFGVLGFTPGSLLVGYGMRRREGSQGAAPGIVRVLRFYLSDLLMPIRYVRWLGCSEAKGGGGFASTRYGAVFLQVAASRGMLFRD